MCYRERESSSSPAQGLQQRYDKYKKFISYYNSEQIPPVKPPCPFAFRAARLRASRVPLLLRSSGSGVLGAWWRLLIFAPMGGGWSGVLGAYATMDLWFGLILYVTFNAISFVNVSRTDTNIFVWEILEILALTLYCIRLTKVRFCFLPYI